MKHSPPLLGALALGGSLVQVVNCAHYRHDGKAMSCAIGLKPGLSECMGCASRSPLVAVTVSAAAAAAPAPVRGLGDVVESCIRWAFLGRLDVAHRLAALVERAFPTRRRPDPVQRKRGCGCAARKAALNAALPLR